MNVAVKPSKHTAAGQYLGYSLQPVRLCYRLLTGPRDSRVSIEHVDDVGVHFQDGSVVFEQTKSALTGNPISNLAEELWKTISIWIEIITADPGMLKKARFHLYVTPAHAGDWASSLHTASKSADVDALIAVIRADLKARRKPPACASAIEAFLNMDTVLRVDFVSRITIDCADADPLNPIRAVYSGALAPQLVDLVCSHAIGRAKERADALIRSKQPAIIEAGAFQDEIKAFIRANNLPNLLVSIAQSPEETEIADVLSERPVFVRQLELIEASQAQQVRAVSDYLRSAADKARWAETGIIFEPDVVAWNEDLLRRYEFVREEVSQTQVTSGAVVRGKLVYARCAQADVRMSGRDVPGHFVHGSYAQLSDIPKLGWHEAFESLLDGDE